MRYLLILVLGAVSWGQTLVGCGPTSVICNQGTMTNTFICGATINGKPVGIPCPRHDAPILLARLPDQIPETITTKTYWRDDGFDPKASMDVPAAKTTKKEFIGFDTSCEKSICYPGELTMTPRYASKSEWTCADKSRVLLTSEDGKKHCIKF
jgi:hypothetical protein